jgi:hypothetical protein
LDAQDLHVHDAQQVAVLGVVSDWLEASCMFDSVEQLLLSVATL